MIDGEKRSAMIVSISHQWLRVQIIGLSRTVSHASHMRTSISAVIMSEAALGKQTTRISLNARDLL